MKKQTSDHLFSPLLLFSSVLLVAIVAIFVYEGFGDHFKWQTIPKRSEIEQNKSTAPVAKVQDGIHVESGLVYAAGFELVKTQCTTCHSAQLITQNRASRAGWEQMIRWMQATQGLWELGDNERPILDYLAEHYAPEEEGRRANLDVEAIEWYVLELEEKENLTSEEVSF
ncbi:MAG: hypothetical protein AAGI23_04890 [Bacteroidota bacterium]